MRLKEYKILEIHSMPRDKMMKYFNMTFEESLKDLLYHVDMGKVCEDTVVFPPGREISINSPEDRKQKMLGPDLSFRGMGWSRIDPHMYGNILNKKKRADEVIDNLKSKKHVNFMYSLKNLLEKLTKIKKKRKK